MITLRSFFTPTTIEGFHNVFETHSSAHPPFVIKHLSLLPPDFCASVSCLSICLLFMLYFCYFIFVMCMVIFTILIVYELFFYFLYRFVYTSCTDTVFQNVLIDIVQNVYPNDIIHLYVYRIEPYHSLDVISKHHVHNIHHMNLHKFA